MREVTKADWIKNPTPRMMWVWGGYYGSTNKVKRFVLHYLTAEDARCPFVAEDENSRTVSYWQHCAEIEPNARMTNQRLSWWIREHPEEHRELCRDGLNVSYYYGYSLDEANEPCPADIRIRSNGGPWHEPLLEYEIADN